MKNHIIYEDVQTILQEKIDWDYLSGKSILITGANGFIASYIVYVLLELNKTRFSNDPMSIIALVRNQEKANKKFAQFVSRSDFELLISDVSIPVEIHEKIDIIIHAASQASPKYFGKNPVGTLKANTIGTVNMLELAQYNYVERFLYISSGEVYGVIDSSMECMTEAYTGNVDITNIRSCYAESKRMGENMCVCVGLINMVFM